MNSTEYNVNKHKELDDVLTLSQVFRVEAWLKKHRKHVCNIIMETNKNYPPTELYDKINPHCWKPEYWRWYLGELVK